MSKHHPCQYRFRYLRNEASRLLELIEDSFRVGPYLSIFLNVLLACLLSLVTTNENAERLREQGLYMSNLVSGAAISIVTLTFSLTILSVQIAAQSYSPRLLEDFIRDRAAKAVISVNLGSYSYCYCLGFFLFEGNVSRGVPQCGHSGFNCANGLGLVHVCHVSTLFH
jgi:uncharacterized membrane protein